MSTQNGYQVAVLSTSGGNFVHLISFDNSDFLNIQMIKIDIIPYLQVLLNPFVTIFEVHSQHILLFPHLYPFYGNLWLFLEMFSIPLIY